MPLKPQAVPSSLICSVCGLSWSDHKRKTVEECIRLLKAEVARRRVWTQASGTNIAYPGVWSSGRKPA